MPSRCSRSSFVLAVLCALVVSPLRAQDPAPVPAPAPARAPDSTQVKERSPIDQLIDRMRADINDLKYAEAIRRGNELFASFATALRPSQLIELRQSMAAAFYPDEVEAQMPDSALVHLVELVKLSAEVRIPTELRWAGLDSLLEVARSRTFAVTVRHADETILVGTDGRGFVDVVTSRPARFSLRVVAAGSADSVVHDTAATGKRARLAFRGHDGKQPLFRSGEYSLIVTAVDSATGEALSFAQRATAIGEIPVLSPPPTFNERLLKPEQSRPPRVKMVITGILFSAATVAIASQGRAEEPILSAFGTDGRATMVAAAMLGAVAGSFFLDKGTPIRDNIVANATLRENHRRAVTDAEAENLRLIATYRVTVRINPEVR